MSFLNIAMFLEHATLHVPDKIYTHDGNRALTFHLMDTDAQRFANVLLELGVKPGEKIALLLPNVSLFPVCYYGTLKLGAVPVPLSVMSPGPEVAYYLGDSEATVLITSAQFINAALEGFDRTPGCRHLIVSSASDDVFVPASVQRFEDLMNKARNVFDTMPVRPEDPAVILYTSGTTGRPKGAVLTHFNYYFFSSLLARDLWRVGPDDRMLMVAPAAHIFGQVMINVACASFAELNLISKFTPQTFLKTIEERKITFFAGVPTLGMLLLQSSLSDRYDTSSLRLLMFGGAPMPPGMPEQIKERFKVEVITGYGMTEAVPVTFVTEDMVNVPPDSAGLPVFGTSVRIVDPDGQDEGAGELGEIIVRGPQVFKGYYNRTEETSDVMKNGWLHTGDLGRLDENGFLFIVDRLKFIIKTAGYTVFPAEVESVLLKHAAVAEAVVIGVAHQTMGQMVKAFAVLKPDNDIASDELIKYCKTQLASYKCPRSIEFRDTLPRNAAGKILRRDLHE